VIAQRSVATKEANKKAIAEGKPPLHGVVGKQRKKTAKNVAYAAQPPPHHQRPRGRQRAPSEPRRRAAAPEASPRRDFDDHARRTNGVAHS